ncbi:hypothetical protein BN8_01959 [Fibrisoma limi BUZ 3]|uniref:Uncharacterized protein n=1 Tax=Fibrisoma limi BUZ 3 TaxID=1185876 RepID=I2GG91_9BACT|nr:hypothetical protein [Fibrisoma limi]CCH52916.1 hypothetical protein BN8_01959 [Fibrisoma limi BUZ 3]
MKSELIITNLSWNKEDLDFFEVSLTNGIYEVMVPLFSIDNLKTFGHRLIDFPRSVKDVVVFQEGQDKGDWSGYLNVQVFCFDPNGQVAINVAAQVKDDDVRSYRSTFTLVCEAAAVNRLGIKLTNWRPDVDRKFVWRSTD